MNAAGSIVFSNLSLLLCFGLCIGLAKKDKGVAALAGVVGYLVMTGTTSAILAIANHKGNAVDTGVIVVNKNNTKRTYLQNFLRECVLKFALGPVFLLFSIVYFIINNVFLLKDINVEMPYDTLLKTKVLNMAS